MINDLIMPTSQCLKKLCPYHVAWLNNNFFRTMHWLSIACLLTESTTESTMIDRHFRCSGQMG